MKRSTKALLALSAGGAAAAYAAAGRRRHWRAMTDEDGADWQTFEGGAEMTVETSDGATLAATVVGPSDGPTVVLAHGWTEGRPVWVKVARRLVRSGHRVIVYDQRGHGASTLGREPFEVSRLGRDLAEVLAHFDVTDAVLAGHSMGGMTIMALINDDPTVIKERASAVVLVATSAVASTPGGPLDPIASRVISSAWVSKQMQGKRGTQFTRGAFGAGPHYRHLRTTADMFAATDRRAIRDAYMAISRMDLRAGLAGCPVPATVVVGSRDALTPVRLAQMIAGSIAGARLEIVPNAGHMLPFERPDLVAGLIDSARKRSAVLG